MENGLRRSMLALVCAAVLLAGIPATAKEQAFKGKIGKSQSRFNLKTSNLMRDFELI